MSHSTHLHLLVLSLLLGTSCTQDPTNIDAVSNDNTSTINESAINQNVSNTNSKTSIVENNADYLGSIDTLNWNKFTFEELGFSISMPFSIGELEKHYTECGPDEGCDTDGYSYTVLARRDTHNYVLLGSVSEYWSKPSGGQIYWIYDLDVSGKEVKMIYQGNEVTIHPIKTVSVSENNIYIIDPIQDYYGNSELYPGGSIEPAYAAIIKLQGNKYKAAMLYVEQADMSLDELVTAIKTIRFTDE